VRVCVIGGGIAGLSAAYFLSQKGHKVTIIEKDKCGGLAATFPLEGTYLEKFYHHFFRTDKDLLEMIEGLGLKDKIKWYKSKVGFYIDGKVHDFSTPFSIAKFRPLSIINRIKLVMIIMYLNAIKDWKKLDDIMISKWHKSHFCHEVYRKVWEPLLKLKFSGFYREISMAWLWGRIHPRSKSRDGLYEHLGYLDGSSQVLFDELISYLKKNGSEILEKTSVEKIIAKNGKVEGIYYNKKYHKFDCFVSTVPLQILGWLLPDAVEKKGVKYQGMVIFITKSKKQFTDKYWLNICDEGFPFGGIIEQTNLVGKKRYNGFNIAYFLNYIPQGHKFFDYTDEQLFREFFPYMKKIAPSMEKSDIKEYFVFRTKFASPVYLRGFSKNMPSIETKYSNLFISTTANIYPEDRNLSNGIKISKLVGDRIENSSS
jgi:protoporphyrinogen oxidase